MTIYDEVDYEIIQTYENKQEMLQFYGPFSNQPDDKINAIYAIPKKNEVYRYNEKEYAFNYDAIKASFSTPIIKGNFDTGLASVGELIDVGLSEKNGQLCFYHSTNEYGGFFLPNVKVILTQYYNYRYSVSPADIVRVSLNLEAGAARSYVRFDKVDLYGNVEAQLGRIDFNGINVRNTFWVDWNSTGNINLSNCVYIDAEGNFYQSGGAFVLAIGKVDKAGNTLPSQTARASMFTELKPSNGVAFKHDYKNLIFNVDGQARQVTIKNLAPSSHILIKSKGTLASDGSSRKIYNTDRANTFYEFKPFTKVTNEETTITLRSNTYRIVLLNNATKVAETVHNTDLSLTQLKRTEYDEFGRIILGDDYSLTKKKYLLKIEKEKRYDFEAIAKNINGQIIVFCPTNEPDDNEVIRGRVLDIGYKDKHTEENFLDGYITIEEIL